MAAIQLLEPSYAASMDAHDKEFRGREKEIGIESSTLMGHVSYPKDNLNMGSNISLLIYKKSYDLFRCLF